MIFVYTDYISYHEDIRHFCDIAIIEIATYYTDFDVKSYFDRHWSVYFYAYRIETKKKSRNGKS